MAKIRLLIQWIGHSDLRAMAASLPAAMREEIMRQVKQFWDSEIDMVVN